jgi:hypothetical protein
MMFIFGILVGSLITVVVMSVGMEHGTDYDGFEDTK